jgi:Histidine kinase-, DNA gyrase B-, and HSP90-like ATPase
MCDSGPVEELRKTKLFLALSKADSAYSHRIEKFVTGVAPILATTVQHFPYYTRHDAHHGYNVTKRIEHVIKAECFDECTAASLSAVEIFLLIAAAYAHDLGMTVFPNEKGELLSQLEITKSLGWETNPILQAHLRSEHSRRGGKYIAENADSLGVPKNLVSLLDKLMKAHNLGIADLEKELRSPYAAQAQELDALQLAVIVCAADALEFSDTRVFDGVIGKLLSEKSETGRTSFQENMKHVCVGDSLAIRQDGSVLVSGSFSDEEVLALAHRTFDEMESWIQGYCDIDRRSKMPRLKVRPEPFTRTLDFSGGRFERLGVRLNKKNVIDLIASNAVWQNNKGIAVRELVQNAVEACRYRAHHSSSADAYVPAVEVVFDRAQCSVQVSDNGCGMSERTVLNNFLTVGSSRSREPGYAKTGYASIARFGIGFWSVFTIAEHAQISTSEFESFKNSPGNFQKAEGFAFEVSLDELKEYTVFRPLDRPSGTSVTLKLHPDVIIDDVYTQGWDMLLCSGVSVTFTLDGVETKVPAEVPNVSVKDVMGQRGRLMNDLGLQLYQWRGIANDLEVTLGIAYRMEDGKATFLVQPESSVSLVMSNGIHYPKTSVCGFMAPMLRIPFCIEFERIGTCFANHKNPSGFEFALDRQRLQPNDTALKFSQEIVDLVHEGYRAFLTATNSNDLATKAALRKQAMMHGGNVYDTFTGSELMHAFKSYPDLLSVRLYQVSPERSFSEAVPFYVDLNGLKTLSGELYFIQRRPMLENGGESPLNIGLDTGDAVLSYDAVRYLMNVGVILGAAYVIVADRLSSMMFDADPESSVRFHANSQLGFLCVQNSKIDRMSLDAPPKNILAEVQGRWSGAIYSRQFTTPVSKPYLFLGRHRVLVARSSTLASHIEKLSAENRKLEIASLIADLKEDEQGFTSEAVSRLL